MQPDPTACAHCPDGHGTPARCAWAVWIADEVDSDRQPTHLRVQPTDGAHVADADAVWLRALIRAWRPTGVYALPDPPASLAVPLRDSEGRLWRYDADKARWCLPSGAWIDNWHRMVIRFGPLTEVTDV